MKRFAIFSEEKGFYLGGNSDSSWSWLLDDAILFRVEDHYQEGSVADYISDDDNSTFINPDNIRQLNHDDAVAEFISLIEFTNGDDLANTLNTLTGDNWEYEGDSSWLCNGRTLDGDNIIEVVNELCFDHVSLTEALNTHSEKFYWAEDPDEGETIYATAAPDLTNFKEQAQSLLEELDTLANFHLKDDGLKSNDCQLVGIQQAIFEVQKLVNGTSAMDVDNDK